MPQQPPRPNFNEGVLGQEPTEADKFNQKFQDEKQRIKNLNNITDQNELDKLNTVILTKPLYNYTFLDIFIGIKDAWFGILDDLLNEQFTFVTLIKDNRLFFIGLTLLIIGLILYLYSMPFDNISTNITNTGTTKQ